MYIYYISQKRCVANKGYLMHNLDAMSIMNCAFDKPYLFLFMYGVHIPSKLKKHGLRIQA